MLALARAGDEVILPVPYYFNHQMWLDMQGIGTRHLPFRADRGGVPDPAEAAAMISPRTRAIVLVSPNNPTGAVFPAEVIGEFYKLARRHDIALILDETYRDFMPTDEAPHVVGAKQEQLGNPIRRAIKSRQAADLICGRADDGPAHGLLGACLTERPRDAVGAAVARRVVLLDELQVELENESDVGQGKSLGRR